jgi:hypothetical protein
MKRAILVALLTLLCVAPASAEVFWDPGDRPDTDITDKDFKYDYQGLVPAKSFRQMDVYFTPESVLPDWAEDLLSSEQPEGAVTQEREADVSRPPVVLPPVVRPPTERRTQRVAPQPTESSTTSTPSTSRRTSRPEPQVVERSVGPGKSSGGESTDKPGSKRMKWGQPEVKSDEEKTKFQWGQQKQQQ